MSGHATVSRSSGEKGGTLDHRDRWVMLAFFVVALLLRLPGHLDAGIWFDEIWLVVETIRGPFGSLVTSFESDNHHPLYSVAAWLSVRAFGEAIWSLRLPAVLFGAASVAMMWHLSLHVTSRAEATVATVLLCVSYHHVWFSQNARGYTMLLFWTLAATHFLVKLYDAPHRRDWVAYALCLALATFTHSSAVLVGAAHAAIAVTLAVTRPDGERRWAPLTGVLLAGVMSLALHLAMLGDMIRFFTGSNAPPGPAITENSEWTSLWWTVSAVVESLGVPVGLGYAGLVAGASVLVVGTVVTFRRDWRHALLYVLPAVLGIVVTIALGRSLRPRFLFHLSGFALLIVVAGVFTVCEWVARRASMRRQPRLEVGLKSAATVFMLAASLLILPRAYSLPKQDFQGALEYVTNARTAADVVAVTGLTVLPYRSYFDTDFPEIGGTEELDRLLAEFEAVYVLHTIPIFLRSTEPSLATRLAEAPEVARFRGSLGDGDVVVLRLVGGS